MKKIILLLMFFVLLCGCSNKSETDNTSSQIAPSVTVNNGTEIKSLEDIKPKTEEKEPEAAPESQTEDLIYYGNLNTKKFHRSNCVFADDIKEKNLVVTRDREELISEKFVPCKFCVP